MRPKPLASPLVAPALPSPTPVLAAKAKPVDRFERSTGAPPLALQTVAPPAQDPAPLLTSLATLVDQYERSPSKDTLAALSAIADKLALIANRSGDAAALDAVAAPLFRRAQIAEARAQTIAPNEVDAGYHSPRELFDANLAGLRGEAKVDHPAEAFHMGRALRIEGVEQSDLEDFLVTGVWTDKLQHIGERAMTTGEWTARNAYCALLYLEASTLRARRQEETLPPDELAAIETRLKALRHAVTTVNLTASDMRVAGGERKLERANQHGAAALQYAEQARATTDPKEAARLTKRAAREEALEKTTRATAVDTLHSEACYLGNKTDHHSHLRSRASRAWVSVATGQIDTGRAQRNSKTLAASIAASRAEIEGAEPIANGPSPSALYAVAQAKRYDPANPDIARAEQGAAQNVASYLYKLGNERTLYFRWRDRVSGAIDKQLKTSPQTTSEAIAYAELQRDKGEIAAERAEVLAAPLADRREIEGLAKEYAGQMQEYQQTIQASPATTDHSAEAELARRNLTQQGENLKVIAARLAAAHARLPISSADATSATSVEFPTVDAAVTIADRSYTAWRTVLNDDVTRQREQLTLLAGKRRTDALEVIDYTEKLATEASLGVAEYFARSHSDAGKPRGALATEALDQALAHIKGLTKSDPYRALVAPQAIELTAVVGETFVLEQPATSKRLFDDGHQALSLLADGTIKTQLSERIAVAPMRALDTIAEHAHDVAKNDRVPDQLLAQSTAWRKEISDTSAGAKEIDAGVTKYARILATADAPARLSGVQMHNGDTKALKLAEKTKEAFDDLVDAAISDLGDLVWDIFTESPEDKHRRINREQYDAQVKNLAEYTTRADAALTAWVDDFDVAKKDGRGLSYLVAKKAVTPDTNLPLLATYHQMDSIDPAPVLQLMGQRDLAFMSGPAAFVVNEQRDRYIDWRKQNGWAVYASLGADVMWSAGLAFLAPEFLPATIARIGAVSRTLGQAVGAARAMETLATLGATAGRVLRASKAAQTVIRVGAIGGRAFGFGATRATVAAQRWATARKILFIVGGSYGARKLSQHAFGRYSTITKIVNVTTYAAPMGGTPADRALSAWQAGRALGRYVIVPGVPFVGAQVVMPRPSNQ